MVGVFTIIMIAILMIGKCIESSEGMIVIAFILGILLSNGGVLLDKRAIEFFKCFYYKIRKFHRCYKGYDLREKYQNIKILKREKTKWWEKAHYKIKDVKI